jgi:hypothetical protein
MKKLNFLFKFGTILATICWFLLIFFPAYTTENKQYIIGVIGILSCLYVYSLKIVKNHDETIYPKGELPLKDKLTKNGHRQIKNFGQHLLHRTCLWTNK